MVFFRNSVGCLLVYDVCNRESFTHIPTWMNEAKRHIEPHKVQGLPSGFDLMYLALADRNKQVRFGLKVVLES